MSSHKPLKSRRKRPIDEIVTSGDRERRIRELHQLVRSGRYHVDLERLADAIEARRPLPASGATTTACPRARWPRG